MSVAALKNNKLEFQAPREDPEDDRLNTGLSSSLQPWNAAFCAWLMLFSNKKKVCNCPVVPMSLVSLQD